jgi:purine-binding chemotaxis protein CheW
MQDNFSLEMNKENKYLIFQLNNTLLGVDIVNVIEIIEYKPITKVPWLTNFMHGLLNLRGKVIPIIDFSLYLEQHSTIVSKKTCVVLLECIIKGQSMVLGVLVDNVLDVIEIAPSRLEKPAILGAKIKIEFVKNMFILDNKIILLLNLDKLFANENFVKIAQQD